MFFELRWRLIAQSGISLIRTVNLIGYWITGLADEKFPAPQEIVGTLDRSAREHLAKYLDAGQSSPDRSYLGYSWCRFFCGIRNTEMGSRELSDGEWAWPEGLSHYVREHNVLLPEEFIDHVLACNISTRQPSDIRAAKDSRSIVPVEDHDLSLGYWRQWCAERRSDRFLRQLQKARIEADENAGKAHERLVSEIVEGAIQKYGIGADKCIWTCCDKNALRGLAFCANHYARTDVSNLLEHQLAIHYSITKKFMSRCFGPERK